MSEPKSAVLAIGTELTNGQIINRNASWISQKLLKMGLSTHAHLTIPDDRKQIAQELRHLAGQVNLLFVTGGLGPTSDDFTRDCIAEWSGKKLLWNEPAWAWITERLKERNVVVREFQKQQCYFPEGSQVLHNALGTAHGFHLSLPDIEVFVLPGPPREIESVWNKSIEPWLQLKFKDVDRSLVKSWDCFGVGESEVAHRAEAALKECPFEKGYRTHLPYVEFKLFYKKSQTAQAEVYFSKVEQALAPWVVARDGEDSAQDLLMSFKNLEEIHIRDEVSQGYLWQRLTPGLKDLGLTQKLQFSHKIENDSQPEAKAHRLILSLRERAVRQVQIEWNLNHRKHALAAESPYKALLMRERERHFFAEKAILFWSSLRELC